MGFGTTFRGRLPNRHLKSQKVDYWHGFEVHVILDQIRVLLLPMLLEDPPNGKSPKFIPCLER